MTFTGHGRAHGTVARREEDGRFALVSVDDHIRCLVRATARARRLARSVAKAERDCFIGASLTAKPAYVWNVDGEEL